MRVEEPEPRPNDLAPSSRRSAAGAGWACQTPGTFRARMPERAPRFSWLRPSVLWRSRNDVLARLFGDPSSDLRRRWVAARAARGVAPDLMVDQTDMSAYSFMVLGDTGEGDVSQYALVPGLLRAADQTAFAVIASDVIYPTGSGNEYGDKFFRPYQDYPAPIYAVPGNHDWYDGLAGFMRFFCAEPAMRDLPLGRGLRGRLRRWLWRRPDVIDEATLEAARRLRGDPGQHIELPGPYWTIDTGPLRIVGIDTGITGTVDHDQGDWLRRVSAGPKPKLLITGKPLYVDGKKKPCRIEGGGTVDAIVADPACNYVAAIGGDIHNYQRYPIRHGNRTVQYLVAGGGGAFMHATHVIPRVNIDDHDATLDEEEFRCYPLRGDSLAFYSRLYARRLRLRFLELSQEAAAAAVAARLSMTVTRAVDGPPEPSRRARLVAALFGVPPGPRRRRSHLRLPVRRVYHRLFSEFSDWDTPPLFKSFLRIDVDDAAVRIRCLAATGCGEHELTPPVEDDITIPLAGGEGVEPSAGE